MTPDGLRAAIGLIEECVVLSQEDPAVVRFDAPSIQDLMHLGIPEDEARRLLGAPWWDEMAAEIVDTPSFCAAGEPAATVLRYARDVVGEYIRKRYSPTSGTAT